MLQRSVVSAVRRSVKGRVGGLMVERAYGTSTAARTGLLSQMVARQGLTSTHVSSRWCTVLYAPQKGIRHYNQNSTFVSEHYRIDDSEIVSYLERRHLTFKFANSTQIVLQHCPFCHDHKGKSDNLWKLYISREKGSYHCFRCAAKGSWFDFKRNTQGSAHAFEITPARISSERVPIHVDPALPEAHNNYEKFKKQVELVTSKRKITADTMQKYRVGFAFQNFRNDKDTFEEHFCIIFPWTENTSNGVTNIRYKIRSLKDKKKQRMFPLSSAIEQQPDDAPWKTCGMFGWHTVPEDAKEIIITEGEFDALAVHQATGIPTVSLPNGAASLPVDLLPRLERFSKIYLWMDDDIPGREGAEKFCTKLGLNRTYFVPTRRGNPNGPKDANDALIQGHDLKEILAGAHKMPHKQIVQYQSLRNEVFLEFLEKDTRMGKKSSTIPSLNKVLKGFRKGELTILTGPTGTGKTTLLSQLSLDYCMNGVPTLWGSFEIKNVQLLKRMLMQFASKSQEETLLDFENISERFSQLPLYFLKFWGSTNLEEVLSAMEHSVYLYDIEHIIIDNIQFMMSGQARGADKFDLQDKVIEMCRQFATTKNVHITLVVHPRKGDDDVSLSLSSIFGTAKSTQEADNVLIIQNTDGCKFLEVKKNRYDGDLGKIRISYDKKTNKFADDGLIEKDAEDAKPKKAAKKVEKIDNKEKSAKTKKEKEPKAVTATSTPQTPSTIDNSLYDGF